MNRFNLAFVAPLLLAACASTAGQVGYRDTGGEVGYPLGSLGYAAIMKGDLARAEAQLLKDKSVDRKDPARLLNLAHIYKKTGRADRARQLYEEVARSGSDLQLELANGDVATAQQFAMRALATPDGYAAIR